MDRRRPGPRRARHRRPHRPLQPLHLRRTPSAASSSSSSSSSASPPFAGSPPAASTPDAFSRLNGIRATNALPNRATTREEFLRGAALGWSLLLAAILPMMFLGSLHPDFNLSLPNLGYTLLSLLTIAIATLALEVAFRGFLFIQFIEATGPVSATLFLSFLYAILLRLPPRRHTPQRPRHLPLRHPLLHRLPPHPRPLDRLGNPLRLDAPPPP